MEEELVFFQATEEHFYNDHYCVVTLYFERMPTEEEMEKIIQEICGELGEWWEAPTPVSEKAKLVRIQIL